MSDVKQNYHRLVGMSEGSVYGYPNRDPLERVIMNHVFLLHSITLGGFGADRFYLGQWREGLGKLFSFGGLGIWTLIDVLLIGVGYVGPADGSLYI